MLWVRSIINTPANDCNAQSIVDSILALKDEYLNNCTVEILNEEQLKQMGMTLLLKVNDGSHNKPFFNPFGSQRFHSIINQLLLLYFLH